VQLTDEQEAELLEALAERLPHRHEQLLELKKERPDHYKHVIARLWMWYKDWKLLPDETKEDAMQEQDLHIESIRLAREYRAADASERRQIRAKLKGVLKRKFELSLRVREQRLAAMQKEIQRLREENADRQAKRDQIVNDQVSSILQVPDDRPPRPDREGRPPRPDAEADPPDEPAEPESRPTTQPADDEN